MASGNVSLKQFESLTGNQIRGIVRAFKTGKMTALQLAEHWGVSLATIESAIAFRESRTTKADA